jgi:tryptophan halogenase
MINHVLILGGGSAGFLTAITLKVRLPKLAVTVLRSPDPAGASAADIGEGTTVDFPRHLHGYLRLDPGDFHRGARPIRKLGTRFLLWGPRPWFDYTFEPQIDTQYMKLPRGAGYYVAADEAGFDDVGLATALMSRNAAFALDERGLPAIGRDLAYHLEYDALVNWLISIAGRMGVMMTSGTVAEVRRDEQGGVRELLLESGATIGAGFFVDCSEARSLLLGDALGEPFDSFKSSLLCDRAVVGSWQRGGPDEPIQPYTTAETMDAGWCWRIDHAHRINRGYVYNSAFIGDDAAEAEFRAKNPRITSTRLVKFTQGCHRRSWVSNVVSIGSASGFVEPLEGTSLGSVCVLAQNLAEMFAESDLRPTESMRNLFNLRAAKRWSAIRRFLAMHYKFNTRLQTPFWQACQADVDLAGAEPIVEFYRENGPSTMFRNDLLDPRDQFGVEGYLSMLIGQSVPCKAYQPSQEERALWQQIRAGWARRASRAIGADHALAILSDERFGWPQGAFQ